MDGIGPKLRFAAKQKIFKQMKYCRDIKVKQRYLIIVNLMAGRPPISAVAVLLMTVQLSKLFAKSF